MPRLFRVAEGSKNRLLLAATALAVLWCGLPDGASAQTCDPARQTITATAQVADGTDYPYATWTLTYSGAFGGNYAWGSPGTLILGTAVPSTTFYLRATGGVYATGTATAVTCTRDASGCNDCDPKTVTLELYSTMGSFNGHITRIPDYWIPASGAGVSAKPNEAGRVSEATYANANGDYTFTSPTEPGASRNWGVHLWQGSGPFSGSFKLSSGSAAVPDATTTSSKTTPFNFEVWGPSYKTPPDMRCDPGTGCCLDVGRPVNLFTGNAYLDQTDVQVPGLGGGLSFVRSYNSKDLNTSGVFGYGWTFSYEQSLSFYTTNIIILRKGNGLPIYYVNGGAGDLYTASVPITEESQIVKQADGSYRRNFRSGGYETYSSQGRLTSLVDPAGNTTTITRNGSGQITAITAAGGRVLTLDYDGSGRVWHLYGPQSALVATYLYDAASRLSSVSYADGSGYTFEYDPYNQVTAVKDLSGRTLESHAYNSTWAITSEISDGVERYLLAQDAVFDPVRTTVTDALGNATTYEYGSFRGMRRVTKVTGPCASCGGGSVTDGWTYDDKGQVLSHTDGAGNTTSYTYDPATGDRLSSTIVVDGVAQTTSYTYYADGRVQTITDPEGGVTTYEYGPAGPTRITQAVSQTETRATSFTYTPQGKVETITDPRGKITRFAYNTYGDVTSVTDPLGNVTSYGYDSFGRRTTLTTPMNQVTTYFYDGRGRVTKITVPDGSRDGASTSFAYDKGGRRTSVTDDLGRTTSYAYDPYGRLQTVTDPALGVTQYAYDAMSRLVSLTDARGKATSFEYDAYGRVTKVVYPPGGPTAPFESFSYDGAGRLATKTDRNGVTTSYAYDGAGRLREKTYSDTTPLVSYAYDATGRLLSASNGTDSLGWTYDLAGQLLSESSARNASIVSYTYDAGGNRLSVSLDGTLFLSYAYDNASRLSSITRGSKVFSFGYDQNSRRTTMSYPNAVATTYSYDTLDRLTNVTAKLSTTTIAQAKYTYDSVGNRLSKTLPEYGESYSYDALYRLTQAKRKSITEKYTYDPVGNRLSALNSSPWTYGDRNELLSTPTAAFAYDPSGNLETKMDSTGTWNYLFDAENRLSQVLKNGGEVARFAYDPRGRRVEKLAGGVTTSYAYAREDILRETSAGTVKKYVHGPGIDEPLAVEDGSGALSYSHADGLGSIVKTTNSAGSVTLSRQYDAFGNLQAGSTTPGHSYTGREWDPETGLYYYRARYYDPRSGGFISADPIGFKAGVNFYSYVLNSPTTWIDPTGTDIWDVWNELDTPGSWYTVAAIETPNIFPDDDRQRHCYYACISIRRRLGPFHLNGLPSDWPLVDGVRQAARFGWRAAHFDGQGAADAVGDYVADLYGVGYSMIPWKTCEEQCRECPVRRR